MLVLPAASIAACVFSARSISGEHVRVDVHGQRDLAVPEVFITVRGDAPAAGMNDAHE
jgi:hypothetical protein